MMVRLSACRTGDVATIEALEDKDGGPLIDLGFEPGRTLEVLAKYPWEGPILLKLGNAKIALAKSMANKVLVRID